MNMKTSELKIQKLIDQFNKDFMTKLKSGNIKFLGRMYDNFINQFSSSPNDEKDFDKLSELEEKLMSSFTPEQAELFEQWNETKEHIYNDMQQQSFVYGVCAYQQINKEVK